MVDLHIDQGLNAPLLSIFLYWKYWLFNLPTVRSPELFYQVSDEVGRLYRIGYKLEWGIGYITGLEAAVLLPAGAIYCVFIISGGLLLTMPKYSPLLCSTDWMIGSNRHESELLRTISNNLVSAYKRRLVSSRLTDHYVDTYRVCLFDSA